MKDNLTSEALLKKGYAIGLLNRIGDKCLVWEREGVGGNWVWVPVKVKGKRLEYNLEGEQSKELINFLKDETKC